MLLTNLDSSFEASICCVLASFVLDWMLSHSLFLLFPDIARLSFLSFLLSCWFGNWHTGVWAFMGTTASHIWKRLDFLVLHGNPRGLS
jgi:hypothetical protein